MHVCEECYEIFPSVVLRNAPKILGHENRRNVEEVDELTLDFVSCRWRAKHVRSHYRDSESHVLLFDERAVELHPPTPALPRCEPAEPACIQSLEVESGEAVRP